MHSRFFGAVAGMQSLDYIVCQGQTFLASAEKGRHVTVDLAHAVQLAVHPEDTEFPGKRQDIVKHPAHRVAAYTLQAKYLLSGLHQVGVANAPVFHPAGGLQDTLAIGLGLLFDPQAVGENMVVYHVGPSAAFAHEFEGAHVHQADCQQDKSHGLSQTQGRPGGLQQADHKNYRRNYPKPLEIDPQFG